MRAYVFPGQGAQYEGMGKELFEKSEQARHIFNEADDILGFNLSQIMLSGTAEDLKETKVTQPAIFVHSIAAWSAAPETPRPDVVAGHSLGEFSSLVGAGVLSFRDALGLVAIRASAMQKACEKVPSTMAAVVGLEDTQVEAICESIPGIVVPANYNCPGQLVISGELEAVEKAIELCQEAGARMVVPLQVGGAFHSPLMEPAREELAGKIHDTHFSSPICPIYQNVTGKPYRDPVKIKQNLIDQLTAPVMWTQTMRNMIADGVSKFVEVGGNGKVLSGLIKRLDRKMECDRL